MLQKELLKLANSKEGYNDIANEIYRLHEEKYKVLMEEVEKRSASQRLLDITAFLEGQPILIEGEMSKS